MHETVRHILVVDNPTLEKHSIILRLSRNLDNRVALVTTNFDTHFEDALAAAGRRPFVSAYQNNLEATERTNDYPSLFPSPEDDKAAMRLLQARLVG